MPFVIIFALIVSIFAVIFALQNPTIVPLHFIMWDFEQPLALFLLIAMAVGAIIIAILTIPNWLKTRSQNNKHKKEVAELEDNLSKYRSNLIDAQNSNKDLRQKILEIEGDKEDLEAQIAKLDDEINKLNEALEKADISAQEADQARKDAFEARDNMNMAVRELEIKLESAEESSDTYKDMLEKMSTAFPYSVPGIGGEIDTLMEEAALDEAPTPKPEPEAAAPAEAETTEETTEPEPEPEKEVVESQPEKKKKFFSRL